MAVKEASVDASTQIELLQEVTEKLNAMKAALKELKDVTAKASAEESNQAKAEAFKSDVMSAMAKLRKPADELEMIVDKDVWPIPTYGDLLF